MSANSAWRVITAQTPGLNHVNSKFECQDRWAVRECVGGTILAVADGAGSARRGSTGAQFAVEAAVEELERKLTSTAANAEALRQILVSGGRAVKRRVDAEVKALAHSRGETERVYATTLSIVVLSPPLIGYWAIGDGFAVVETDTTTALLVQPHRTGGIAAEAEFLTDCDLERDVMIEIAYLPSVRGIGLSTDGLIESTLKRAPGSSALAAPADVYGPIFKHIRAGNDAGEIVRHMLTSFSTVSGDDKTLVVAVRHG